MSEAEIVARRRKWMAAEKAALLAEVEAEGGRVSVVARRHGISDSLLYNWRSAWKAAISLRSPAPVELVPIGVIGRASDEGPAMTPMPESPPLSGSRRGDRVGMISLAPGTRVFLACRPVDLRNGFDGLAAKVQQMIGADPFSGHLFIFRGTRGDYFKGSRR